MADPTFAPLSPFEVQRLEEGRARQATQGGFNQSLVSSGYQLGRALGYKSADEKRAEEVARVMGEAELTTETDDTDPLQRRFDVLSNAARKFNSMGMIDLVQQVTPELLSLKRQMVEQRKLLAEARESEATTEGKQLDNEFDRVTFIARWQKAEAEARAAGENNHAWYDPATTTWHTVNEGDPGSTKQARDKGWVKGTFGLAAMKAEDLSRTGEAKLFDIKERFISATDYVSQMTSILPTVLDTSAGSLAGPVAQTLANAAFQARQLMGSKGLSPQEIALTKEGKDPEALVASLGLRRKQLTNAVIDMAYARARQRDPGGRLSNQDVEMAVRIFNANNAQELMVTLFAERGRLEREMGHLAGAYQGLLDPADPAVKQFGDTTAAFDATVSQRGTNAPSALEQRIQQIIKGP